MAIVYPIIPERVVDFFNFMNERHAIYLRRQRGDEWPWTEDSILQTYKFTNVYRELDTGTIWLRKNIIEPYWDHPELFFNIAVYRRINLIASMTEVGFIEKYDDHYRTMMKARQVRGEPIFTPAYMTCGGIRADDGTVYHSKVDQFFGVAFPRLWANRHNMEPQPGDTLEVAFNRWMANKSSGFGHFIVYEGITDLRHTRYLKDATDIYKWANPGPGAGRGIARLMNLHVIYNDREEFAKDRPLWNDRDMLIASMRLLLDHSRYYLAEWMDDLEMRDIEHSLCEFDKYERARLGEGRPKAKFTAPHLR